METYRQKWQKKIKTKIKIKYGQIKLGNPDHKSGKQLYTIKHVKNIYDSRQNIIDQFNSYLKIRSEAIYK